MTVSGRRAYVSHGAPAGTQCVTIHRVAFLTHPNKRTHNYEARSNCFGGTSHKCWGQCHRVLDQDPGGSSTLRADLTPHNASEFLQSGFLRRLWSQSGQKWRVFPHFVHFSNNQKHRLNVHLLDTSLSPSVVEGNHGNDGLLLGRPLEEPHKAIADKSLLEILDGMVMMYNLSVHQQLGKVKSH